MQKTTKTRGRPPKAKGGQGLITPQRPCKKRNTAKKDPSMASAREHIEEIRKERFWIGVGSNPLSKPLRMAVKYLSAELYSKDVHFLMELIQNAEDNEYPEGVEPSLEFMLTSRDITATGAQTTLLIFNNEKGFSRKNMESICTVGDSTKAGNRKHGYIGEKGIGFKSVFLLTAQPYIFSNGYQIRFSETPCPDCDIAYIVPEWVDSNPSVLDIQQIYGSSRTLPTTTIILPLKPDKVKAVKDQLSSLHSELLLFLSKIKRISVKEDNDNPSLNTVRAISISSERDFLTKKNIDAESYTVHLSSQENGNNPEGECMYYMWRQRFPVKKENKVEKRMDVDEWAITLAFPYGTRLNRGMRSAGIYAFLPTETITDLPFIIQADFLLPSSRETILWDNIWNQGILNCVPIAFISAFVSLVRTREDAPVSSLANMFMFLPMKTSCHSKVNAIRESIRGKLLQENIIPSESHSNQKFFHKPHEVGRLMPAFWSILLNAKKQGAKLHNLSSQGKHILHSSFDTDKYNSVFDFLGVEFVNYEWYPKCIQSCNLVLGVGEDVYMELLRFVAENWTSHFYSTTMISIPLIKHVGSGGDVSLRSVYGSVFYSISLCRSTYTQHISWLIDWSKEFGVATRTYFLPKKIQECCSKEDAVSIWLRDHVKVKTLTVNEYASQIHPSLKNNRTLVIAFAHFLCESFSNRFLSESEVKNLCRVMPLVNSYGVISVSRKGVLVPANGSKWVDLMSSNPWKGEDYVELAEEYLHSGKYSGQSISTTRLISFLKKWVGACDIPDIRPPDATFPAVYGPLTKKNAFLLLDWVRKLRPKGIKPGKFLSCIKDGSWLKVTISGFPGYKPPSQSFLPSSSWGSLAQSGSNLVDIPIIDEGFYDNKIRDYEEELKVIGVISECKEACKFIANHVMSLAANSDLSRTKVIAMLNFIRFLRDKYFPLEDFIDSIKSVEWVKTQCGVKSPVGCVLYDQSWEAPSAISQIPFLDRDYYGEDILEYKTELNLLGVMVSFQGNYQVVIDHLKPPTCLSCLMAEPLIFALKCMQNSSSSAKLVDSITSAKCLRTNIGYLSPGECFLLDDKWGCILQVFEDFPYIDGNHYYSPEC